MAMFPRLYGTALAVPVPFVTTCLWVSGFSASFVN